MVRKILKHFETTCDKCHKDINSAYMDMSASTNWIPMNWTNYHGLDLCPECTAKNSAYLKERQEWQDKNKDRILQSLVDRTTALVRALQKKSGWSEEYTAVVSTLGEWERAGKPNNGEQFNQGESVWPDDDYDYHWPDEEQWENEGGLWDDPYGGIV
jgi:hypothetical protein